MNTTASIIMPVLNEAAVLANAASSLQRLQRHAQLLIVDGGSRDDSARLASAITPLLVQTAPGRALQMNAGAARASGDYLIFLHCDTVLPDDFSSFIATLKQSSPDWGFFAISLEPRIPGLAVVARFMNWRSRLTAVATGDQAIFVRRELFLAIGGYADIPLMEDVELSKRLRRRSRPLIWRSPVQTSSRRWQARGLLRTVLLMWSLRLQYFLGVSPQRLHHRYYGR